MYLNKLNLIILHCVIFSLRDWIKTIKKGLFKRLENIKDKNEELLNAFSATNKAKNDSDYNYDSKYSFYNFHRDFKKFKRMSLGSKCGEMKDF